MQKILKIGECFGKISYLKRKNGDIIPAYLYNYKAEENCELIEFEWDAFREILIKPAKDEFVHRIKLLKDAKYIKEIDPYCAVILSLLGTIKSYSYADIILKQDILPSAFYIILQGECKCVYDKVMSRSEELRSEEIKKSSRGFSFALKDYKFNDINSNGRQGSPEPKKQIQIKKLDKNEQKAKMQGRSFENEKVKVLQIKNQQFRKEISYRAHINFSILVEGHCFCSRTLLSEEVIRKRIIISKDLREPKICKKYDKLRDSISFLNKINSTVSILPHSSTKQQKEEILQKSEQEKKDQLMIINSKEIDEHYESLFSSQLSIVFFTIRKIKKIANTATVRILSLPKTCVQILAEQTAQKLLEFVERDLFMDADRPYKHKCDLKEKLSEHQQWDTYKKGLREMKAKSCGKIKPIFGV